MELSTSRRRLFAVLALLPVLPLAACAGSAKRESTGEYIDDSAITSKVKAAFVQDKAVDALDIKVVTFKGNVQLSGFASSEAERRRAVDLARAVPGVKSVSNDILIK